MTIKRITNLVKNIFLLILRPKLFFIRITYILKRLFFDFYFIFKKPYKYNFIFIAGMPMSSTTRVKNMCGLIPGYYTRYMPMPHEIEILGDISNSAFIFSPSWSYNLFKTHLNPKEKNISILKNNNVKKIIVVYRDLRDVVVARYYRLLKFPKKKNEPDYLPIERQYSNISKSEGIDHCIEHVAKLFVSWIFNWIELSKKEKDFVLFCKFEDLVKNPKEEFKKILNFYEIKLS